MNTTSYAGHRVELNCRTDGYLIAWFLNGVSSLQETGEPYRTKTLDYGRILKLSAVFINDVATVVQTDMCFQVCAGQTKFACLSYIYL